MCRHLCLCSEQLSDTNAEITKSSMRRAVSVMSMDHLHPHQGHTGNKTTTAQEDLFQRK